MTPPVLQHVLEGIPPSLQWPVKTCVYTSIVCYILSVATGNVSQVDRIWTFMPLIYTAYFALLPLWPKSSPLPLFPFTPKDVYPSVSKSYNPRALLMLGLVVSLLLAYVSEMRKLRASFRSRLFGLPGVFWLQYMLYCVLM